jgi:lactate dehydrogenase-like 2-hydroxyacid dehydrogenase
MPGTLFISRQLPQEALDLARGRAEVRVNSEDRRLGKAELATRLADVEALVCLLTDTVDEEVLAQAPRLRVVANIAVGYDNIDVPAATRRKIVVTNTPGVLTETTADFTWALLLATARRVPEGDAYTRGGKFTEWGLMVLLGGDVHGKTLDPGLGRVGRAVAQRAVASTCDSSTTTRCATTLPSATSGSSTPRRRRCSARPTSSPSTCRPPETLHYIDEPELRRMKPTAYWSTPPAVPWSTRPPSCAP